MHGRDGLNYDSEATDDDGTCEYPAASVFDIIAQRNAHGVGGLHCGRRSGRHADQRRPVDDVRTDGRGGWRLPGGAGRIARRYGLLTEVLKYHLFPDSFTNTLSNGLVLSTLNGQQATITFSGGSIFIEDAEIIIADLLAENGVIYVIDAVIVPSIEGCTEILFCNYDPLADSDDGSCEFESCAGCLNASACNFDPDATLNDPASCVLPRSVGLGTRGLRRQLSALCWRGTGGASPGQYGVRWSGLKHRHVGGALGTTDLSGYQCYGPTSRWKMKMIF